jgi:hypothetical protein
VRALTGHRPFISSSLHSYYLTGIRSPGVYLDATMSYLNQTSLQIVSLLVTCSFIAVVATRCHNPCAPVGRAERERPLASRFAREMATPAVPMATGAGSDGESREQPQPAVRSCPIQFIFRGLEGHPSSPANPAKICSLSLRPASIRSSSLPCPPPVGPNNTSPHQQQ